MLAAPCCHHDIAAQLRRSPTPAPYAMLTRHGILRERFADTLTDALRASLLRLQGYRVDVMQFVESKHTPRNTMLRAVRTGAPVKGGGVRKEYDELVDDVGGPAAARRAAGACRMRERVVGRRGRGAVRARRRWPSPADGRRRGRSASRTRQIVESSGLVVADGLFVTTNDSGDTGRVFMVDPATGETVGVTTWPGEPEDVEALAPAGAGRRLGRRHRRQRRRPRDSIERHPAAGRPRRPGRRRRRPTSWSTPTAPRDAETLLADPRTGRLLVASKGIFGGTLYAAPRELSADGPNPLRELGDDPADRHRRRVLPRRPAPRAARLRARGRLHLPRPRGGRRARPARAAAGRGDRGRRRRRGSTSASEGRARAGARGDAARRLRAVRGRRRPSRAPSPSAEPSPTPARARARSCREAEPQSSREPWQWLLGTALFVVAVVVVLRAVRPR